MLIDLGVLEPFFIHNDNIDNMNDYKLQLILFSNL